MEDFFSNVPDIVIDKILQKLPIRIAAQTSVLSKQWERGWLSLKILSFDSDFWDHSDWQKCSRIISNILLYHNGPVQVFYLRIPFNTSMDHRSHSQWISFLSKNGVRDLFIGNHPFSRIDISSYIFQCNEIEDLKLLGCNLNSPPTDFSGFPNLRKLELSLVHFNKPNVFRSLIENCKMLEMLKLEMCYGMDHVVIDLPSLQTLRLSGDFQSLAFINVRSLKSISLSLNSIKTLTIDSVTLLSSSCQLQYISFNGHLCKYFAAGGVERSSLVTFNHLDELCLTDLSLSEFGVLRDLLSMIKRCPYIKKLNISVISGENVSQDMIHFNDNYKLDHLREVSIKGITGSSAELKLVEYLLAISPVLENLFFKSGRISIESELKMSRTLMGFPRASTKARLLFLENKQAPI